MNICVVGCGGIGTHLIQMLTAQIDTDRNDVYVMDGDVFEEKNMDRQVFAPEHLGVNKAVAMASMYGLIAVPEYLQDPSQLERYDLVFCVPDNNDCRLVALLGADSYTQRLIIAGNEARSANAYLYSVDDVPYADPRIRYPHMLDEEISEVMSCHEAQETKPQTRLANIMAASFSLALYTYWYEVATEVPKDILDIYAPVEFIWAPSAVKTIKTGDLNDQHD